MVTEQEEAHTMKKRVIFAAVGAVAALGSVVSPAHAETNNILITTGGKTHNKCLGLVHGRPGTRPVEFPNCDILSWWRYGGDGSYLKSANNNRCLDTNGSDVYFSDCNSSDSGQRWRMDCGSSGVIYSRRLENQHNVPHDEVLTVSNSSPYLKVNHYGSVGDEKWFQWGFVNPCGG
ncbi:ricin-type beta-trefoil lectin domain protein [Streptomyces sp. NPDC001177]